LSGVSFLFIACFSADDAAAPAGVEVVPLQSPAAESSGEPYLSLGNDGILLSWLQAVDSVTHELRMAVLQGDAWSAPVTVARSDAFFVNWADFPSIVEVAPGRLAAHWLQRTGAGTYDYGVRVSQSTDGGRSWSEPWTPHEDGTPTEHGFVSLFPEAAAGWGLVWLDGRKFFAAEGGRAPEEMTLRYRSVSADGTPGPEVEVDDRICDCCQTDAVMTSNGPIVVYRDRSADEIRDIYVTRLVDGVWTPGQAVHADGWRIDACPVNGPAVAARGELVAVAWFTAANDLPKVNLALSQDGGRTFEAPVRIDDGNPAGRVDVFFTDAQSARVTWLERVGEGAAEVRARGVLVEDGALSEPIVVTRSSDARASGFPRAVAAGGSVVLAWTDVDDSGSRIKLARLRTQSR
jgi:hypothetical protein